MWIDINAYVGHWPFKQMKYNTCAALLERMDQFGVDVSLVANLSGIFYKNTQPANLELYKEAKAVDRDGDRLVLFSIINPIYPGWRNDLEACAKMGMKGVRIYPKYHDYSLTDPSCIEMVKRARDLGMVVGLTLRMVDSRQRSWMDIEDVAGTEKSEWALRDLLPLITAVPDASYLILNLANSYQLNEKETETIKKGKILFDSSGRSISNMAAFLKMFGEDKVAFGTHSPILDYLTGMLRIASLREDEADELTKKLLRSGNAEKLLSISLDSNEFGGKNTIK